MQLQLQRRSLMGSIALLAAVSTSTITVTPTLAQTTKISIDGSSTVFPITEAVAEEFQKANQGKINVTVGISGTGGGFKKFCTGETEISNASRPIKDSEQELCKQAGIEYIELPIAYDALTVVINPSNTWAQTITTEQLKKLWSAKTQSSVTKWSDVNSSWPSQKMSLYAPGTDSGTFDYFNEAVVSKEHRTDFTASEDDNVLVQGVSRDKNAIGYFGYAYYEANKARLKAVAIDNGKGPISPSLSTVEAGIYTPLSRPIFIYVNKKAAQKAEIRQFVDYYIQNAGKFSTEVGYIPLPQDAYQALATNFKNNKVGSVFAGRNTVGVKIADILKLETTKSK
ncbi:MAG: PstS family phosphate ABC transporter substrate-binding protein [Acaryochloridaceae cyanobacterium SU_2_1]|nr:PstS family phosphate ABC transporter substrate-binding protein [Acaryochloridaceae cyanobacterium SU_2_1]